jgi:hypothetical protein
VILPVQALLQTRLTVMLLVIGVVEGLLDSDGLRGNVRLGKGVS